MNASFASDLASKRNAVLELPEAFDLAVLRGSQFRLFRDSTVEIVYTPMTLLRHHARIALVGVTPGASQLRAAYAVVRALLRQGASAAKALEEAKAQAAFSGSMRRNLVQMLDEIGLAAALGVSSCAVLFDTGRDRVHTTSVIRHAVFVDGKNYTGHSPKIADHPELARRAREDLSAELSALPRALVVPLGTAAAAGVRIAGAAMATPPQALVGFPHPSGANGHRLRQFEQNRQRLREVVRRWAEGP